MLTNKTKTLKARAAVRKLESLLPGVNQLRAMASTKEEVAAIEGSFLTWFESKLAHESVDSELRVGARPSLEDLRWDRDSWSTAYRFAALDLQELTQRYLQYENSKQLELAGFEAYLRRVLQKFATTRLWLGKKPLKVLSTSFNTYVGLSPKNLSGTEAYYDFNEGTALLPVLSEKTQQVQAARILAGSNGQPGNSDTRVSNQDTNPLFALNSDDNDWFEYERLDNGPVRLVLALDLAAASLINKLELEFVEGSESTSINIDSIEFLTQSGSKTIKELTGEQPVEFWKLSGTADRSLWSVNFLPVEATSVTLKISATNPMLITDATGAARQRYSIGLKTIRLKALSFDSRGSIASSVQTTGGAHVALPVLHVWPEDQSLYSVKYEYSLNQDGKWATSDLDINTRDLQSTVLLAGNETAYEWRLTLEKNTAAFANATSFSRAATLLPELGTMLASASKFASPATLVISEKPKDDKVFVMQPQLGQVTDASPARYVLGVTTGLVQRLVLPVKAYDMFNLLDDQAEFGVHVVAQIGGELVGVTEISDSPGAGEVTVSSDGTCLVVNYETPGLEVLAAFPGEQLVFTQKPDGYYHTMRALFDPDKDRIRVFCDPLATQVGGKLVQAGKKFLKLDHTDIDYDSIDLIDTSNGSSFGSKKTAYSGLTTGGDYYVDLKKGILFLYEPLTAGQVMRLVYRANTLEELSKDAFDVVVEQGKPVGIRIAVDALKARHVVEALDGNRPYPGVTKDIARRDIRTGELTEVDDTIGAPGYRLNYDGVVPGSLVVEAGTLLSSGKTPVEVPYIDGVSEFTGLKQSDNEATVYLQATPSGIVSFSLAARSLWQSDSGIMFGDSSVFKNPVSAGAVSAAVGNYNVATTGVVLLNVGPNGVLLPGITINYFYVNPDFDPTDKYSINYSFGSLHTQVGLDVSAVVSYKAARYKVWYDIAAPVSDFTYDQSTKIVSVKTENLNETNNLIRVAWTKSTGEPSLEKLATYFSPLVYQLGHVLQ